MKIAVDVDGVLFLERWPEVGPLVPGAVYYMHKLKQDGHDLIIWSSRASASPDLVKRARGLHLMKMALDMYGIPYDTIDYGDSGKIRADLYIDDHGLGAPLRLWDGEVVLDWPLAYQWIGLITLRRKLFGRNDAKDFKDEISES